MACSILCCTGLRTDVWCAAAGKRPSQAASESIIRSNRKADRRYANKRNNGPLSLQPLTKSGNLNVHNLDKLILEWRKTVATPNVSAETLDELETHLRESAAQFVCCGMPVSSAFQRAVSELGAMPGISSEFRKLEQPLWLPVKLAIGATALMALAALVIAIAVLGRRGSSVASLLLATHVFVIFLGYTMTLAHRRIGNLFRQPTVF